MSRSKRLHVFLLCIAALAIARGLAAAPKEKKEKPEKPETYTVVQVDDDYQVVGKTKLKEFQTTINERHQQALKSYQEAKAAAAKAKDKTFKQTAPVKPKVKQTGKSFNTEAEANKYVQKMRDEKNKTKRT
jgi:hypothetical protein